LMDFTKIIYLFQYVCVNTNTNTKYNTIQYNTKYKNKYKRQN